MKDQTVSEQAFAHFDRGLELLVEEANQDAAAEFLLAIRANAPTPYIEAERMLAAAYRAMIESDRDIERAVDQYKKVTSLDANDAGSWLWLALLMDSAALDFKLAGFQARNARGRQQIDMAFKGRQGRKYEKESKRAFAKAEQTFPLLSPVTTEPLTLFMALQAAVAAGDYFTSIDRTDDIRKGIHWYTQSLDIANAITKMPEHAIHETLDVNTFIEQVRRELVLTEEKLAQLKKEDKRAGTFKGITWAVSGAILLALLSCICISVMMLAS